MLTSVLRVLIKNSIKESFDITFIENEKSCQNINFFFSFPIKTFFKWIINQYLKGILLDFFFFFLIKDEVAYIIKNVMVLNENGHWLQAIGSWPILFLKDLSLIWYMCLNICFQYLNNITSIFTYFFTYTYFQKNWKLLFKHTYQTDP